MTERTLSTTLDKQIAKQLTKDMIGQLLANSDVNLLPKLLPTWSKVIIARQNRMLPFPTAQNMLWSALHMVGVMEKGVGGEGEGSGGEE